MVNIYKLKLTILQNEMLRLLFINAGNPMNGREMAQSLTVSQPAISKALPLLEKNSLVLVKKDPRSKRLLITPNRENNEVIWLKRADNLKQVYESGLVKFLNDSLPGTTVILFGSYSSGEDTMQSDIDLAVIGIKYKDMEDFKEFLALKIVNKQMPNEERARSLIEESKKKKEYIETTIKLIPKKK